MSYPDKENTLSLLNDWQKYHAAVKKLMDGITASIGLDINGPMFEVVWGLFDAYTVQLGVRIGDNHAFWLDWFRQENNMGAKAMEAGYNGETKPVSTPEDLYALIAEGRDEI